MERQPLPPKKRVKTGKRYGLYDRLFLIVCALGDHTASRLSVVSASASDNQTLLQISPVVDTTVPVFEAMDVDTSVLRTTISEDRTAPPTPREPSEVVRVLFALLQRPWRPLLLLLRLHLSLLLLSPLLLLLLLLLPHLPHLLLLLLLQHLVYKLLHRVSSISTGYNRSVWCMGITQS